MLRKLGQNIIYIWQNQLIFLLHVSNLIFLTVTREHSHNKLSFSKKFLENFIQYASFKQRASLTEFRLTNPSKKKIARANKDKKKLIQIMHFPIRTNYILHKIRVFAYVFHTLSSKICVNSAECFY